MYIGVYKEAKTMIFFDCIHIVVVHFHQQNVIKMVCSVESAIFDLKCVTVA